MPPPTQPSQESAAKMTEELQRQLQELQKQVNYWRSSAEFWRKKWSENENELIKLRGDVPPWDPWKDV